MFTDISQLVAPIKLSKIAIHCRLLADEARDDTGRTELLSKADEYERRVVEHLISKMR